MPVTTQLSRALHYLPGQPLNSAQPPEAVDIVPTGGALGAVVHGLDGRRPLSAELLLRLKAALHQHLILIFKQQTLSEEQQLAFASYFGSVFRPPEDVPVLASAQTTGLPPDVVSVSNLPGGHTGHGELTPHADHQWTPLPSSGSLLYALELPQQDGDTSWYNLVQAYEDLDDDLKHEIDRLQLITYNPFLRPFDGSPRPLYRTPDREPLGAAFPHPLVRTHPDSGRKALFLSSHVEVEIPGYEPARGAALIERLRAHLANPRYRYTHHWQVGDLVYWDNQVTLHSRTAFDPNDRRVLNRVSLAGSRPF